MHLDSAFCVLVPVKPVRVAKSRLSPLGDDRRRALAAAFALDTVESALAASTVGAVMVVTDDHELAALADEVGAHVVPDGVADDLNASLVQAAAEAARRFPHLSPAALCADLPALDPTALDEVLRDSVASQCVFVPDLAGEGTTLLAARGVGVFDPAFGPGSRTRHLARGATEIRDASPTVRRDVDTPEDLDAVVRLGVGRHTARALDITRV